MSKSFPSEIEFGSLLVYSVRGTSAMSQTSRKRVRDLLKRGEESVVRRAALRARECRDTFPGYFDDDVALVPIPRSSPIQQGDLWPSMLICEALRGEGLGGSILPCLARKTGVEKAAVSKGTRRVTKHLESLELELDLHAPSCFLLVDDVVTSGSTLFAAAQLFARAGRTDVRGFAILRAMSDGEIEHPLAPVTGTIRYRGGSDTTKRDP